MNQSKSANSLYLGILFEMQISKNKSVRNYISQVVSLSISQLVS